MATFAVVLITQRHKEGVQSIRLCSHLHFSLASFLTERVLRPRWPKLDRSGSSALPSEVKALPRNHVPHLHYSNLRLVVDASHLLVKVFPIHFTLIGQSFAFAANASPSFVQAMPFCQCLAFIGQNFAFAANASPSFVKALPFCQYLAFIGQNLARLLKPRSLTPLG